MIAIIDFVVGVIVGAILMSVGPLVCLAVPAETGAKGLLIASVLFQLASPANGVLPRLAPSAVPQGFQVVLQLLSLVGFVLFVLFMKKLAEYIGRQDLALRARNVLIGFGITLGLGLVMVLGMIRQIEAVMLLFIPFVIAAVVALVMYANLVNWLRKALRGG